MPHEIDILIEDDRWTAIDLATIAAKAIEKALSDQNTDNAELSVLGCDDTRISTLNADFREKPTATNVLSWPDENLAPDLDGGTPTAPEPDHTGCICLGDIAIAYDTCAREAAEQGKSMADHVTHLIVHATLHLLGYDHIRDLDATRMEALEVKILGSMGLPDPY